MLLHLILRLKEHCRGHYIVLDMEVKAAFKLWFHRQDAQL